MVSRQDLRSASAANASGGGGAQPGTPRASGAAAGAGATGTPIQGSGLPAPPAIRQSSTGGGRQSSSTGGNNGNGGAGSNGTGGGSTSINGGPTGGTATTTNVKAFGAVEFRSSNEIDETQGLINPAEIDIDPNSKTHKWQQATVENPKENERISLEIFHMDTGSLHQTSALKSLLKNSAGLKLVERRLISSHYTEAFELPELMVDDAAVLSCRNKDQLLRCFDLGSTKNIFEDNVSESHAKAVSSLIVLTGSKQHLYLDKWSYNYVLNCCSSELKSELEKIMDKLPKQHRALPTLLYNLKNLTMMADPKVVKAMEDQLEQLLKNEGITVVGGEDVPNFTEAVELLGSSVSGLGGNIRDYPEAFLEGLSLTTSNSTFRATMKQASVEATSNSWQLISAKLGKNVADMGPLDKLKAISTYAKELYWPLSFRGEWKPEGSRGRGKKKTGVANIFLLDFHKPGGDKPKDGESACHPNCPHQNCGSRQECFARYKKEKRNKSKNGKGKENKTNNRNYKRNATWTNANWSARGIQMIQSGDSVVPMMNCNACGMLVSDHSTRTHPAWQAGTLTLAATHPLKLAQAAVCPPAPGRPAPRINPGAPPVPAPAPQAPSPTINISARVVCKKLDDIERSSTDPTVVAMLPTLRELLGLN
ncbi:hypothetical protein THAOC_15554 [Thalassiosira oceanica]|uniref:Uncharacterized protein n=1 Tax=Thalassiosira oceanica TaxID=159749 RepID=K0SCG6_THAOC|nr:hypothetical protein THAOC_15554 [Thalassiosira oceanica]|eukprot:EJK63768.1 hypothetical protein THAOC_15554 [Thalassiosira oceanica]